MPSISSRIPTFTWAALAFARLLWRPPYRRIFGWGFAVLLVSVVVYDVWAGRNWVGYRKLAAAKGQVIDLPKAASASVPDAENFAAARGPFAPAPTAGNDQGDSQAMRWLDFSGMSFKGPDLDSGKRMTIEQAYAPSEFVYRPKKGSGSAEKASDSKMLYPHNAEDFLQYCNEHFASGWLAILAAEAKPKVQYPFTPHQIPQTQVPVSMFRMAAELHGQRAMAFLDLGRNEEARDEIQRELHLIRVLKDHGSPGNLIEYMVAVALTNHAIDRVWEGLVDQRWLEADLVALRDDLASVDVAAGWAKAINGERAFGNVYFDNLADGSAKSRATILREIFDPFHKANSAVFWAAGGCFPSGIARENQVVFNESIDHVVNMIGTDGRWHPEAWDYDRFAAKARRPDLFLSVMATPSCERAACRIAATEARLRQASLAIAIERYRQRRGVLPERIENMVPDFVAAGPENPVDGRPIRYVRDSADSFRLLCSAESPVKGAPHLSEVVTIPRENGAELVWPGLGLMR